ncbi:hypothetical protein K2X92_00635 [Candidatus Gracilibacteria bacterium]|nr:hypothetical protein [Candidatus Gracilibacteria bacterium]
MSISKEFLEIRELFNNSRKEQRISFLEVLNDLSRGIIDFRKKPSPTPELLYFKPILDLFTKGILEEISNTTPETIDKFLGLFPLSPPGMLVSIIGIKKARVRISEDLREFYKTIGEKEEEDIKWNRKIFLGILESFGVIEKQDIENSEIHKYILEYVDEICNINEIGEMSIKNIEDIKDVGFNEIHSVGKDLLQEDYFEKGMKELEDIEIGNFFVNGSQIDDLYIFLKNWNGITDYSSHFNKTTGEVVYQNKPIPFEIGDNPFLLLEMLYESEMEKGVDLEDAYLLIGRKRGWNRRIDYDQGGKDQLGNVIKGINKRFKKDFSNQKLIRTSGGVAHLNM